MSTEVKDVSPQSTEWINNDFVQKALRSGDGDQSITVVSTEVRMANAVGDGYASDMYRVTAQLEDGTARSLIVKCHPQGGKHEEMVREWKAFSTELVMLTKTLPAMWKLLEEAKPGKYPPFAARCLYHGDQPLQFLVLEDLKQLDFTLAERQRGLDLPHCSLIAKSLARFHAASLALHARDPAAVECHADSLYNEAMEPHLKEITQVTFRFVADEISTWPSCNEKYVVKMRNLVDSCYDRLVAVCKRQEGGYNVLTHSDPWISNMMFKYNDGTLTDMRMVDFQTAHYTSPGIDLQYFLTTCPNMEVRANNIHQLIQEYRTTLNDTLEDLGYTENQISMEELYKEFNAHEFYSVFATVFILPLVFSHPEDGFDFEGVLQGNTEKMDAAKKLFSCETYKRALEIILPIFDASGSI